MIRRHTIRTLAAVFCTIWAAILSVEHTGRGGWGQLAAFAAPARFVTVTAGIRPEFPKKGERQTFIAVVRSNRNLGRVRVDFEVYDDRGARVFQGVKTTTLAAEHPTTVTQTYLSGPHNFAGVQHLQIGIFSFDWKKRYTWTDAATFQVRGQKRPLISVRGKVSSSHIHPGQSVKLTAIVSIRGVGLTGFLGDIEVYRDATKVYQWSKPGLSVSRNGTLKITAHWHVPATSQSGIYIMKIGIFGKNWAPLYIWNGFAATLIAG